MKANRHLPGVPSAQEQIQAGSVSLSEMQRLHLEKIEELTLYAIEADKKMSQQGSEITAIKVTNLKLQVDNQQLQQSNRDLALRLARIDALLLK